MLIQNSFKIACCLAATVAAYTGPLDKGAISSDAKWLVHLNLDALRGSAVGSFVLDQMIKPELEDAEELKKADLSINLTNISSITAYGPSLSEKGDGVLMLKTSANVRKDLDSVAGVFLLAAGTNAPFLMVQQSPLPLYSFANSVFFAPGDNMLFVAKSKDQIERAIDLANGRGENLAKTGALRKLQEMPESLLTVAVAEGFTGDAGIPVQAQVLKEATGGRITLGERGENVFVNVVFQGRDEMATTRIQQVLQGIVALVSLTQDDKDIMQLVGAARIASEGREVMVNLEYPVKKTVALLKEKHQEKRERESDKKEKNSRAAEEQEAPPEGEPKSTSGSIK